MAADAIAVVVRFQRFGSDDPEHRVSLMKAFTTPEEADLEAARLNQAASENPRLSGKVHYFVKIARDARRS